MVGEKDINYSAIKYGKGTKVMNDNYKMLLEVSEKDPIKIISVLEKIRTYDMYEISK